MFGPKLPAPLAAAGLAAVVLAGGAATAAPALAAAGPASAPALSSAVSSSARTASSPLRAAVGVRAAGPAVTDPGAGVDPSTGLGADDPGAGALDAPSASGADTPADPSLDTPAYPADPSYPTDPSAGAAAGGPSGVPGYPADPSSGDASDPGAGPGAGAGADPSYDATSGGGASAFGAHAVNISPASVAPGGMVTIRLGAACTAGHTAKASAAVFVDSITLAPAGDGNGLEGSAFIKSDAASGSYAVSVACDGGTSAAQASVTVTTSTSPITPVTPLKPVRPVPAGGGGTAQLAAGPAAAGSSAVPLAVTGAFAAVGLAGLAVRRRRVTDRRG